MRDLGEPFPPEHSSEEWMARRQIQSNLDTAVLDLSAMFAARLKTPRLGRGPRTFVVADLDEEKLLAVLFREFLELRAALFPGGGNFQSAWVRRFRKREITEDADVIERIPEFHIGVFVPIRPVGDLAIINSAHRRDDLAPAVVVLLRVSEFQADAKNFGVLGFGQGRHLDDPRFVLGKEAVPFFWRDKIDLD